MSKVTARIEDHFAELTDPRRREGVYPLLNIVVMALCAVVSGADDFVAIARWSNMKKDWLARFLDMSEGVPSHDRFNAIMGALRPPEFEKCLFSWITALQYSTGVYNSGRSSHACDTPSPSRWGVRHIY